MPSASNPGPRLALDAGTRTLNHVIEPKLSHAALLSYGIRTPLKLLSVIVSPLCASVPLKFNVRPAL
jgi:hypothetical protein